MSRRWIVGLGVGGLVLLLSVAAALAVIGRRAAQEGAPTPGLGEHTEEILRELGYNVGITRDSRRRG